MAQTLVVGAVALDVVLVWNVLQGTPIAGCGGVDGCNTVLGSNFAYFLGAPISILGLLTHLMLLLSLWIAPMETSRSLGRVVTISLASLILMAAAWFFYVQAGILGHYCRLCLMDHAFGCAAALIGLNSFPVSTRRGNQAAGWCIGVGCTILLISGQLIFPTDRIALSPISSTVQTRMLGAARSITISPDVPATNLSELPFLGDARSPTVIVVLFDFTCYNCRRLHPYLVHALQEYPARLCIILLPVPMSPECNRYVAAPIPGHGEACNYARLALALWHHDPMDFRAFSQAFIDPDQPVPPFADARSWAEKRVGEAALNAALGDPAVQRRLNWDVEVFGRVVRSCGRVEMPKLLLGNQVVSGIPTDFTHFDHLLRTYAGVQ